MENIAKSYYSQRGWTYQERLLSRRRLYFLGDQVIFHCRRDRFTEEGESKVKTIFQTGEYKREDDFVISEAEKNQRGTGSEWPLGMFKTSWDLGFRFWSNIV